MAADLRGGHGAVQQSVAYVREVGHGLVQRHQHAHFLEFGQPGDVAAGDVRQALGAGADQNLIVQLRPFVRHSVDLDPGVFAFKLGNEIVHQGLIFRRLCAVMVPEIDGHRGF